MTIHTEHDIFSGQFTAAVKLHTLSDFEGVLRRIVIYIPLFSELGVQAHVVPDRNQSVVHGVCTGIVDR